MGRGLESILDTAFTISSPAKSSTRNYQFFLVPYIVVRKSLCNVGLSITVTSSEQRQQIREPNLHNLIWLLLNKVNATTLKDACY